MYLCDKKVINLISINIYLYILFLLYVVFYYHLWAQTIWRSFVYWVASLSADTMPAPPPSAAVHGIDPAAGSGWVRSGLLCNLWVTESKLLNSLFSFDENPSDASVWLHNTFPFEVVWLDDILPNESFLLDNESTEVVWLAGILSDDSSWLDRNAPGTPVSWFLHGDTLSFCNFAWSKINKCFQSFDSCFYLICQNMSAFNGYILNFSPI